jgi:hypothetical protein
VIEVDSEAIGVVVEVVVEAKGRGHHLGVLRLKVPFLWKRGRWRGLCGTHDPLNSTVSEPWPPR